MPIVADGVHTVICHSHFSTRLFLVRGGIPIPFMKINAASGPRLRFNLGRSGDTAEQKTRAGISRSIGRGAEQRDRARRDVLDDPRRR